MARKKRSPVKKKAAPQKKRKPAARKGSAARKQTTTSRTAAKASSASAMAGGRPASKTVSKRPATSQSAPGSRFVDVPVTPDGSGNDERDFRLVPVTEYNDSAGGYAALSVREDDSLADDYLMPCLRNLFNRAIDGDEDDDTYGALDISADRIDNRAPVSDTTAYPFSAICSLEISKGGGSQVGTGFLVRVNGKTGVVTAGHNIVHNAKLGAGTVNSITVYPGRNGENGFTEREVVSDASRMIVSSEWLNSKNPLLDWGLLVLQNDFGKTFGHLGMQEWDPSDLRKKRFNVVGFPGSSTTTAPRPYSMWGDAGRIFWVGEKTVRYSMDTTGGQSGCPVYAYNGDVATAVGVHNYGHPTYNEATKVTNHIINQIKRVLG
jgi:V8-like Glu-specific endopeptidase